ncbi:MAG: 23S rRNA (uracil(1939)-C(5))-methyltransferase RlmD [Lachnospiraceae bacterium]|nr:23S rRNA (uracil(1939)-C(5))-methyltransferase RlmD [Lachnospiraceae bacterium]
MEFKKNDLVQVEIEDIGHDGEGIGKVEGYTLFVKDAVIGDCVLARITKTKKNYGYARVEKVVTPSSFRVEPKCRFHRQCGGCQIQAMSYDRQLVFKLDKVRNNLLRIGGFTPEQIDAVMEPIVGMEEPWHYRNKAQYPVGYDKNGNLITGFYAGRTHDIVANTDCALGAAENKWILEAVLSYMKENKVTAYDEKSGKGLIRHILIRTGFASREIMVCLVINGKKLPAEEKLIEKLLQIDFAKQEALDKRIVSISVSINTEQTNVIMGKEIRTLWGKDSIEDSIRILEVVQETAHEAGKTNDQGVDFVFTGEAVTFRISPLSFYQVNPRQTEKLYSLALEYAGLTGEETVWDLYCGIGTISLFMAKRAKQVYGVEVIPQAIEDARENARLNGITNAEFYVGKAEEVLPEFYEKAAELQDDNGDRREDSRGKLHPDVIVVDPPRKGCDEKCLDTMLKMQPKRIVYVSCDSATLARDLRILCDGGYEIRQVRCVDQFSQGVHVETVILLSEKRWM